MAAGNTEEELMLITTAVDIIFDDEEEQEAEELLLLAAGKKRAPIPKTENYFELIIPRFEPSDFRSHFRMSKTTFTFLSEILGEDIKSVSPYSKIPVTKKLLITIWTFGNQEVFRSVADRFGVAQSTAWECVMEVSNVFSVRAREFIVWPTGQAITINQREFLEIAHFPGVIGVVDGCNIEISAPHEHSDSYMNRKGYYSINMQGICDARMRFIDVYAACPGSVNDARVWSLSTINEESIRDYEHYFPDQTHILGDKIYTLQFNLLPPYKNYGNLTPTESNFNRVHALTRQIIERVFALLKARFRRLKYLYLQNVEYASLIILTCCCLHNICISLHDEFDEELNIQNDDGDDAANDNHAEVNDARNPQIENQNFQFPAIMKRNIIAEQLYANRQMQ